jgi:hypothetical protein
VTKGVPGQRELSVARANNAHKEQHEPNRIRENANNGFKALLIGIAIANTSGDGLDYVTTASTSQSTPK